MNKKAQKFTNVSTYIVLLAFIGLFSFGIFNLGGEVISNENSNLDNDSVLYITTLQTGMDIDELARQYDVSNAEIEEFILKNQNYSQGTPKDYSVEFQFVKSKGFNIENTIKRIYGFPSFLIGDVLRLPITAWNQILNLIGWFLLVVITLAIINYVRKGVPDQ